MCGAMWARFVAISRRSVPPRPPCYRSIENSPWRHYLLVSKRVRWRTTRARPSSILSPGIGKGSRFGTPHDETSELNSHIHRNPGRRILHEQFAITIERHLRGHGGTVHSASSATEQERDRAKDRVPTDPDVISIDQEITGWDSEESGRGDEVPWYLDVKRAGRGAIGDHASCCSTRRPDQGKGIWTIKSQRDSARNSRTEHRAIREGQRHHLHGSNRGVSQGNGDGDSLGVAAATGKHH